MPIYEYKCRKCGKLSEILQGVGSEKVAVKCGSCGSTDVEKVFSVMSVGKSDSAQQSPCGGSYPLPGAGTGPGPCSGGSCPF